jgi:hypothetical protein
VPILIDLTIGYADTWEAKTLKAFAKASRRSLYNLHLDLKITDYELKACLRQHEILSELAMYNVCIIHRDF